MIGLNKETWIRDFIKRHDHETAGMPRWMLGLPDLPHQCGENPPDDGSDVLDASLVAALVARNRLSEYESEIVNLIAELKRLALASFERKTRAAIISAAAALEGVISKSVGLDVHGNLYSVEPIRHGAAFLFDESGATRCVCGSNVMRTAENAWTCERQQCGKCWVKIGDHYATCGANCWNIKPEPKPYKSNATPTPGSC